MAVCVDVDKMGRGPAGRAEMGADACIHSGFFCADHTSPVKAATPPGEKDFAFLLTPWFRP